MTVREGYLPFRGHRVWFRAVGPGEAPGRLPLLCLHGGPGAPHDYLEPLEALAGGGRRVIFYDQLGCGNSDHPDAAWSVALFVAELAAVRRELGLERVHILGQSWGGMLAMEHALTHPPGLAGLVLADAPASMLQWAAETGRLRAQLPAAALEILDRHEAAGTTDHPEYQEAVLVFYRRHVCRLDPWPDCLQRTFAKLGQDPSVYHALNGPSEFHVTGALRDWDITARLGGIRAPTLVLSGRYDECTPDIAETVRRGIPGAQAVLFENSAHMPHLEETPRFLAVVGGFLDEIEHRG